MVTNLDFPIYRNPTKDCALCPRLKGFRTENKIKNPDWYNAPVPSFGERSSRLLIVGLAPGLRGANRTARPFTGDWAGDLLFKTLYKFDLSNGMYQAHDADGLRLVDCRITNAVRCVPPKNKPVASEIRQCGIFLKSEIGAMQNLQVLLALGSIAHGAILAALGLSKTKFKFGHGYEHKVAEKLYLIDSYHCSRYNTNTGRLTPAMFDEVFEQTIKVLK